MRDSACRRSIFLLLAAAVLLTSASFAEETATSPEQVTMSRMRLLAGALLSVWTDSVSGENRRLAPTAPTAPMAPLAPMAPIDEWVLASEESDLIAVPPARELRTRAGVLRLLRPREDFIYLCDVPELDGWGERIEVYFDESRLLGRRVVTVRSSGANRRFDSERYRVGAFLPGGAIDDIVISDERFVRWPAGVPERELEVEVPPGGCPGPEVATQ